ncbi:hypothetical protein CNR27_05220 [Luteimonas chenhongjianii]|uniref:Chromate transporter n=1 Tax=Luteimonas chenhongjianii TaxID=2006110 RepID=A0A290XCQ9_9GAMM|nr:hypothetical protein CNR27_05220 [Luteimonas chenhongjianii]
MRRLSRRIFGVFLRVGLTAFGGPVAHLAYFHAELVVRRRWLRETEYAELVALCQLRRRAAGGLGDRLRQAG